MHVNTAANSSKSNQNKTFYHDGKWWAIALDATNNRWYIWRYDGGGVWTRNKALDKGAKNRYDVLLDSNLGHLGVLRSHTNTVKFWGLIYSAGTWNTAFSVNIPGFGNSDDANPLSFTAAANGDLWVFRIHNGTLQAKKSTDGGVTWSATPITVKSSLNQNKGTTDAVAFTQSGNHYIGVAYGEEGVSSSTSRYGFLRHLEGDPDSVWTDETHLLTYQGNENANNQISMAVDPNNNIYLITRNFGGSSGVPRNTLYKRSNTGSWSNHAVFFSPAAGWTSPTLAIDTTSNSLILAGIRSDSSFAEYKLVPIGSENTASSVTAARLIFAAGNTLQHATMPRQFVNSTIGTMVCASNTSTNDMWFNLLQNTPTVPVAVDSVIVEPNEVNARASYTVPVVLTDSSNGTLTAGIGTISLRFPFNTYVPAAIAPAHVKVNGVAASTVGTNSSLREVTITTPVTVPGGDTAFVEIDTLAGVYNKTAFGLDSLQAWTSAQPMPVYSPAYNLVRATTTVTAARVALLPTDADSVANYTIGFRLGKHGRMLAGVDTVRVRFNTATQITHGNLLGVQLNGTPAGAAGDSATRTIQIQVPATVETANNDSITLYLPETAVRNPAVNGSYTLFVYTSVETTQVASQPYDIEPSNLFGAPVPGTNSKFDNANQSKVFHHGGYWWLAAESKTDSRWYLWKFDGFTWTQSIQISSAQKARPDVVLVSSSNKAYILLPGPSTTQLLRLSFSGGNWSIDSGYPKTVNSVQESNMVLTRTLGGNLWVFWIADSTLSGQKSTNDGTSWTAKITLKRNLNQATGLVDAVAFQNGGANSIGVGYAENSSNSTSVFGFLRHSESDHDTLWTDETGNLQQPSGTFADNHIAMATHNNEVFMVIKTKGGGGATTLKNGLYHRETNGNWTLYDVIQGNGWTRPVITLDVTNNVLYLFGTREGASQTGEMKRVNFGDYDDLLATPVDTVFYSDLDDFFDSSGPAHNVTSASNLMITSSNVTRDEVWYNLLTLAALPKSSGGAPWAEAAQAPISDYKLAAEVYPNPFNPETTIRFRLDQPGLVRLQIFNMNGQLVRTLINHELNAGQHHRRWNGRNQAGVPVSSGTYIFRLQAGNRIATGRMQLIK
ncbi:MAG: T9SS type A sorting domain-containing protein [candidate division KSB1 bacterium]|nr:T9SS type A sorting domain-containing protein [candidate division KSB1 bacterium]MDZ7286256.1 T9SS type A sorting domain-containing protein [candidate division KSB1 bacterium]MDZ7296482.1 T9SS type A sorting domain-containing protein [candidate division KSB1 bacterium]MDZ7347349.1 T9SS type A sorting domain-containing protein [candidate division KSB1 bacterium]MDZ7380313.1 T9SS type A sorting domain-containing protein [candidate division KSB1 bacterium]